MNSVIYYINGVDLREFGVHVSHAKGIVDKPKLKKTLRTSWDGYHGEVVDLSEKFYEPREMTLECFIEAENRIDFLSRIVQFYELFSTPGTQRLHVQAASKPLIYEVYCKDEISINKKWDDQNMVGTFSLKLVEPEPSKRVLLYNGETCTIQLTTSKLINIYWGDGSVDYDISGVNKTIKHKYSQSGKYYPVITGCIDMISNMSTNGTVVWNKL